MEKNTLEEKIKEEEKDSLFNKIGRFISRYKLPLIIFSALGVGTISAEAIEEHYEKPKERETISQTIEKHPTLAYNFETETKSSKLEGTVNGYIWEYNLHDSLGIEGVKVEITDFVNKDSTFSGPSGFYSVFWTGIPERNQEEIFGMSSEGLNLMINGLESNLRLRGGIYDVSGREIKDFYKERGKDRVKVSLKNLPNGHYLVKIPNYKGEKVTKIGVGILGANKNNSKDEMLNATKGVSEKDEVDTLYQRMLPSDTLHYAKMFPLLLAEGQDTIINAFLLPTDTSKFDMYHFNWLIERTLITSSKRVPDHLSDSMHYDIDTTGMPDDKLQGFINGIRSECKYMSCGVINDSTPINLISSHDSTQLNQRYRFLIIWDPSMGHAESGIMIDQNNPEWIVGGHVEMGPGAQLPSTIREILHILGYRNDLDDSNSFFDPSNSFNTLQPKDSLYRILYMRAPEWYTPDSTPPISAIETRTKSDLSVIHYNKKLDINDKEMIEDLVKVYS